MRKLLLVLSLILVVSIANSQNNFALKWENDVNIISGSDDYGLDAVMDAAGNSYSAGVRGLRTVVRKYNSNGTLLWSNDFFIGSGAGFSIMEPVKLGVDGSGNVYVVTRGTQSNIMKRCVVKYNSAGTQLFANIYGSTLPLHTTDAWIDPTGIVYACGYIEGGAGANDAEVSKYSNTGTLTWQRTYDAGFTIDDERAEALHVDGSNNVYIAGRARNASGDGMLAVKYNSAGTQQWLYTFCQVFNSTARTTYGTAINVDASLNVYLTAYYVLSSTEEPYIIHKLSSAGAFQWGTGGITGYFASAKIRPNDIFISGTEIQVLGQKGLTTPNVFTHQINASTGVGLTPVSHNYIGGFYSNSSRYFIRNLSGIRTKSFVSSDVIKYWNGSSWENHMSPTSTYPAYSRASIDNNNTIVAAGCKEVSASDRSHYVAAWCLKPTITGLPSTFSACTYDTVQMPLATVPSGSTVQWSPSTGLSNPNILNPLVYPSQTGTTYTLTVTNAAGCQNSQNITIGRIPDPSKIIQVRNATTNGSWQTLSTSCGCLTNNTFTLNACPGDVIELRGTSSNFDYLWYKDNSSNIIGTTTSLNTITVNSSGLYFASVSYSSMAPPINANSGCNVLSFAVNVNMTTANISLGPDVAICSGNAATLTAPGGFTSYLWNTGATTQSIFPTAAGTYSVIGTYGSGCQAFDTINVSVNPLPSIELGPTIQSCVGNSVNINAGSGFASYLWSTGATTQSINVTTDANYFVTVTDANGCQNSDNVSVQFNPLPNVIFTANSNSSICNGQQALLEFFGASSYNLMPGNINTTNSSVLVSPTTTTNYTLTGTSSSGCQNTAQFTVTVNAPPTLNSNSNNATCGQNNGSASVSVVTGTGPFTYLWNTGANTSSINNVPSGTYNVTVTAGNGCSANIVIPVNSSGGPSVNITPTNVTCQGGNNGSATANPSGGTSPYSYLWSNGQTTQTATGLAQGSYSVTVTDFTGCQTVQNVNIGFVNALPTVGITGNTTICSGQSTSLTGTGAATYSWSTGANTTSINVAPSSNTTYTVTGTASNGCQNTAQVQVTVNALPTILANTNTPNICLGSSATLTSSGGVSYSWSPGGMTGNSVLVSPTSNTTYTVTGTGSNGCQNTAQVVVNVNTPPVLQTTSSNATCGQSNGTAGVSIVSGSGGYTYLWSNGASAANISGLTSGQYSVVVTDGNGCSSNTSVNVGTTGGATVQINPINVTCQGGNNGSATATPNGGTSPYTYLWNNGQTTQTALNLTEGNYSVTVTDGAGCQTIENVTISFTHSLPTIGISGNTAICLGSSTTLSANGAVSYSWNTGANTASINVAPTSSTLYTVTGTDGNGCTNSSQVNVTVNQNPSVNTSSTDASCGQSDGSATAIPNGGLSPYTYSWNNGGVSQTITGLSANTYSVTVTDANGCIANANVIVANAGAPTVSVNITNSNCESSNNGSALANVSGGATPYSFLWSNGATTSSITNVIAGNYSVQITDANNCITNENVVIGFNNPDPVINLGNDTTICQGASIVLDAGVGYTAYNWSNNATTQTIVVTTNGNYTVNVTDANGCQGADNITITVDVCGGIEDNSEKPEVVIYPNPSLNEWLNVKSNNTISSVEILDLKGSLMISEQNINNESFKINIQHLSQGIYIVKVNNEKETFINKLIVK